MLSIYRKIKIRVRFLFRQRLEISSDFVHAKIKDFIYSVDENDVARYNDAVKNNNRPASSVNNNLHPVFFTKISWQIIEKLNEFLETPIDDRILKTIVHQSEHITFHAELKRPTVINVQSKIWSVKAHKKGTKILIKFDYYSDNELIATELSGGLLFGVKCEGELKSLGVLPKSERIDVPEIWEKKIDIDDSLPYTYAEKTGIDADIHTNPKFAKSIGLPDIILQGTCTFAKAVNLILAEEFHHNSYQIKSVSAKFTDMLVVPNKISVRLLKKENKLLKFDVLNKEGKAVIKGGEISFI